MKLLISTPLYPPDIGGPATYAHTLETELPKRGIEVSLLKFGDVRHLPKGIAHVAYAIKLFRALSDIDMIIALDVASVGFPTALVAMLRGRKFVVKIVGDYAWEQGQQRFGIKVNLNEFVAMPSRLFSWEVGLLRMVQTFVARRAVKVVVPSKYLKGIVTAWGIPPEKITVIYNAFDGVGALSPKVSVRKELGLSGVVIISAGRLVPWKGFHTLIDVVSGLRGEIPDCRLYIAGDGPDAPLLRAYIHEHNLVGTVVMLGDTPHDVLMKYIRGADTFVLNTGYEGLSHLLLEVLAIGTPIVTTSVGGNVELITDGENGTLVPFNDADALVRALIATLGDTGKAELMTKRGTAFVAQFSVNRMIEETTKLLKSLSST